MASDEEFAERPNDRQRLWQAFTDAGVAAGPMPPPQQSDPAVDAAIAFVGAARGPLAIVPLEDIVGAAEQPNLPGTVSQHPNWGRRFALPADQILSQHAAERRLARLNRRHS
jgi:4-alpha-glucanotransferase